MIQLSTEIQSRIDNKDTRKIIVAKLFYDDTNYIPVATVATVIDGEQYLGVLKEISNISQKWNLTEKNNVTVANPSITLVNYQTPNDYQLINEFFNNPIIGKKILIYFGYEGMSLTGMIKAFEGITDDVNYDNGNIKIDIKTQNIPEVNINGRKLNHQTQTIGTSAVPSSVKIHKDVDGKYLPIIFGNHWCAPLQPYFHALTSNHNYYSIGDKEYSNKITFESRIRTDVINWNCGLTGNGVYILNDEYFTPLHVQGWTNDSEQLYTLVNSSTHNLAGLKLSGFMEQGHTRSDDKIFVTVPLRYEFAEDLSNNLVLSGVSATQTATAFARVFDNYNYDAGGGNPLFTFYHIPPHMTTDINVWAKLRLDLGKNLKGDEQGMVRSKRKIHLPLTDSNDGQGYCVGYYMPSVGKFNSPSSGDFVTNWSNSRNYCPIHIFHFKNGFIPEYTELNATLSSSTATETYYIGGTQWGFLQGGTMGYTYDPLDRFLYDYTAKVFNKDSVGYDVDFQNFESTADKINLGYQGEHPTVNANLGVAPFINREAFLDSDKLGVMFNMTLSAYFPKSEISVHRIYLRKIAHLTAGAIDLKKSDALYCSASGASLTSASLLQSTTDTFLNRPYQYLEFLISEKGNGIIGNDFSASSISGKWENFFGTKRDGSGFVIQEELLLNKFVEEYIKYEPFTTFTSEDGTFQFKMLKKTYNDGDEDGSIDFNDATRFSINLTPTKNVVAEIKSLKTDYMYGVDEYVQDINWKLDSGDYNYAFWKGGNTYDNNELKVDSIEKKYTSYTPVDIVVLNGVHYGCVKSNIYEPPTANDGHWNVLINQTATNTWSATANYNGEDAESKEIASWYLNMWANRHRVVTFETNNLSYYIFNVGDVVQFENVPFTNIGLPTKGFNGETDFTSEINGQTTYSVFLITSITKSLTKIQIIAIQLHKLDDYDIVRVN